MFELLTGQLPFIATTATELARMHREEAPLSPCEINPDIPEPLERILLKVLSKEPAARYRTADQLGRVLTTIAQAPRSSSRPVGVNAAPVFSPPEPEGQPVAAARPLRPVLDQPQAASRPVQVAPVPRRLVPPEDNPLDIDWITLALGLLTMLAVGGLIPFAIWVFGRLNLLLR
jgi:serine/threonine-protein kinase